jgi:hypothetical protein
MESPEIAMMPAGPAIAHSSDFSLVTASKPAQVGEILSLFARGLGPVNPGVDPGQPFPSVPLATVNSPVEVTVNGKAAEVLSAVGLPGAVDGYQLNFLSASRNCKRIGKRSGKRSLDFRSGSQRPGAMTTGGNVRRCSRAGGGIGVLRVGNGHPDVQRWMPDCPCSAATLS